MQRHEVNMNIWKSGSLLWLFRVHNIPYLLIHYVTLHYLMYRVLWHGIRFTGYVWNVFFQKGLLSRSLKTICCANIRDDTLKSVLFVWFSNGEQPAVSEPPSRHFLQSRSNDAVVTRIDIRSSSVKLSWKCWCHCVWSPDGAQIVRSCRVLITPKGISTATQDSWYFLTIEFHWVFLEDKKIHEWLMRGCWKYQSSCFYFLNSH